MNEIQIVLDADVIIHFSKGNLLNILPLIFPNYKCIVLDKVYHEIKDEAKTNLDNQIHILKKIKIVEYKPKGEELKEFAILSKNIGKGESACLAFCRFNQHVIGSSNLKDIKNYCTEHSLTYLTTLDFLYYAISKRIISTDEANSFIQQVIKLDSKLPNIDMTSYSCNVMI